MEKKTSKKTKTTAIATTLALVLALGGTLAYLQDVSSLIRNVFDAEPVMHTEVVETTGNSFDVQPGMEDPKDPKAIVTTTTEAYSYVVITDNTMGYVEWEIADGWTEITSGLKTTGAMKVSGDSTFEASGEAANYEHIKKHNGETIQTSGDAIYTGTNQRVFYRKVDASTSDDAREFPILKDNKVTYPADANIPLIAEADWPISLDFQSYIIQAAPWSAGTDETQNATDAWNKQLTKGDIVTFAGSTDKYRVLKVNADDTALVLALDGEDMKVHRDNTSLRDATDIIQLFDGSDMDNYLNTDYFNALPSAVQSAIVPQTIKQTCWKQTGQGETLSDAGSTSTYGHSSFGGEYYMGMEANPAKDKTLANRKVFLLSVDDIIEYLGTPILERDDILTLFGAGLMEDGTGTFSGAWLRSSVDGVNTSLWRIRPKTGMWINGATTILEARGAFVVKYTADGVDPTIVTRPTA